MFKIVVATIIAVIIGSVVRLSIIGIGYITDKSEKHSMSVIIPEDKLTSNTVQTYKKEELGQNEKHN